MLIAVSGNVGSGKTTLARFLAQNYDLRFVPLDRLEFGFIDDFFSDIEGNFLPTQLSFLISKAIELQKLLKNKQNIVLDRSLLEDIVVFARLWTETRKIDERIIKLYQNTADFICRALPKPDLYIFCRCPSSISRQRLASRLPRSFENQYPPHHIERLEVYYEDFRKGIDAPCVEIDTLLYDFTQQNVLSTLCAEIFDQFRQEPYFDQLCLFENSPPQTELLQGLVFRNFENNIRYHRIPQPKQQSYIYLAAPFTQMASVANSAKSDEPNLFSNVDIPEYGCLDIAYQKSLQKIERTLIKYCYMPVHLPHRDINNWGKTNYPSEYLIPKIIDCVEKADAVVAIPGSSIGVHLELGIAIARKIPIVIFDTDDFHSSFFVRGFQELPFVKYFQTSSLSAIPALITSENIAAFISTAKNSSIGGIDYE